MCIFNFSCGPLSLTWSPLRCRPDTSLKLFRQTTTVASLGTFSALVYYEYRDEHHEHGHDNQLQTFVDAHSNLFHIDLLREDTTAFMIAQWYTSRSAGAGLDVQKVDMQVALFKTAQNARINL